MIFIKYVFYTFTIKLNQMSVKYSIVIWMIYIYHILPSHPKWWFSETRQSPVANLGTEEGGAGGKEKKVA